MAASVLLFLLILGLINSSDSLPFPTPRISFPLNSADRPLFHFDLVTNTTTLLLSDDGSTLYVGARDALLSLDVSRSDVISLRNKVDWRPSTEEIRKCESKGKNSEVDCPNFVKVLQPLNSTHLFACGSFAYNPHDAIVDIASFSMVPIVGDKSRRCPFNPFQRNTALAIDGELFVATTTDFKGAKPEISRHFSKDGRPDVSQETSVSLLNDPTFIASSLDRTDRKLYFFFSEVGKEFSFTEELRIPRVAQVCKDDVGGLRTLQKKWTSFAKASLLCQFPKQLPFNVLQDVFTLPPPGGSTGSDTLFYGVFTSQWSMGQESAVCVFSLQDVKTVFTQSYRSFDKQSRQWSSMLGKHAYLGQCGLNSASDSDLDEVKRSFLASEGVKPRGNAPVLVSSGQKYSRVAAMTTTAANGRQYTVLYLLTESGFLHKVVLLDEGAKVIEEIQVFTEYQPIKSLVLSASKGVVYIGTSAGVTSVPLAQCSVHRSCSRCVLARDPHCGWSQTRKQCTSLPGNNENIAQDLENGNVEKACEGESSAASNTEIIVHLNEAVNLTCVKPSKMASVSWTSPRFRPETRNLFIQSADGSLSFLATAVTMGTYRCHAREGPNKEVVASYDVMQFVNPRSVKSPENHEINEADEAYESIVTEEPQPSGEPDDITEGYEEFPTESPASFNDLDYINSEAFDFGLKSSFEGTPGPRKDLHSWVDDKNNDPPHADTVSVTYSYHRELVGVSLLLVVCVCVLLLGVIHVWHQTKNEKLNRLVGTEDGIETPALSSPEVKVEE